MMHEGKVWAELLLQPGEGISLGPMGWWREFFQPSAGRSEDEFTSAADECRKFF